MIETLRRSCLETGLYWKDGLEIYFWEGVGIVCNKWCVMSASHKAQRYVMWCRHK